MTDSFSPAFRVFACVSAGALAMAALPSLLAPWLERGVPALWWAGRAWGLLAYVASWLSTLFGVLIAGRGSRPAWLDRAIVMELHSRWSVATLVATALHVLCVVGDAHSGIGVVAALLPVGSEPIDAMIAIGSFAAWGLVLVAGTTAAYRKLPRPLWRAVHASALGTFVLAFAHGAGAGTDTQSLWVRSLYTVTAAALFLAIAHRVLSALRERARAQAPADS